MARHPEKSIKKQPELRQIHYYPKPAISKQNSKFSLLIYGLGRVVSTLRKRDKLYTRHALRGELPLR